MDRTEIVSACFLAFSVWVYLTISLHDKSEVSRSLWLPTMVALVISLVALFGKLNEKYEYAPTQDKITEKNEGELHCEYRER